MVSNPTPRAETRQLIETRQLFEQVYDLLKERIVSGELLPNQPLKIRDIGKPLGV